MSKLKGLVPGGEKTSHASGNDITYTIQESGRKVKIEGDEYHLCASSLQSEKVHEFKNMTSKQVLDKLYDLHHCDITPGVANTGDFIVCKLAVRNPEKRNWTGTVKELLNVMQSKYGCNLAYSGKEKYDTGGPVSVNPPKSAEEIASMHNLNPEYIRYQSEIGTESEMKEHGCDRNTAYILTMHHLELNPDCYCVNDFMSGNEMSAGGAMIAKVLPGAIENSRKSFECGYAMYQKYGKGKKSISEFMNVLRAKGPENAHFWNEYQQCLKESMERSAKLAAEAFAEGGEFDTNDDSFGVAGYIDLSKELPEVVNDSATSSVPVYDINFEKKENIFYIPIKVTTAEDCKTIITKLIKTPAFAKEGETAFFTFLLSQSNEFYGFIKKENSHLPYQNTSEQIEYFKEVCISLPRGVVFCVVSKGKKRISDDDKQALSIGFDSLGCRILDITYYDLDSGEFYSQESNASFANGGNISKAKYEDLSQRLPSIISDSGNSGFYPSIKVIKSGIHQLDSPIKAVNTPRMASQIFYSFWNKGKIAAVEEFCVMYMNSRNKPIGLMRHSLGGISGTVVEPIIITSVAIKLKAKGVIVCHNHPSGSTSPSQPDIKMSKQLKTALMAVGCTLVDSMIVFPESENYTSLSDDFLFAKGGSIGFGKYKGTPFKDLPKDYYNWLYATYLKEKQYKKATMLAYQRSKGAFEEGLTGIRVYGKSRNGNLIIEIQNLMSRQYREYALLDDNNNFLREIILYNSDQRGLFFIDREADTPINENKMIFHKFSLIDKDTNRRYEVTVPLYFKDHNGKINRIYWSNRDFASNAQDLERLTNEAIQKEQDSNKMEHGGTMEIAPIKAYRYYVGDNAFLESENPKNKYGKGVYFCTNSERFREPGRKFIEVTITPKNPMVFESSHLPNLNYIRAMRESGFADKNQFNDFIFSSGHDAIIIKHSATWGDEIILPGPGCVSSVVMIDEMMKMGGTAGKIKFDKNDIPSKRIYEYTQILKENYPKVWALGGNVFGNKAYRNLERVIKRGYWLESEEWMYVKWKSFVARHAGDFLIAGIIANLKWMVFPARGAEYSKDVVREEIMKRYPEKEILLKDGGEIEGGETSMQIIDEGVVQNTDKAAEILARVQELTDTVDGYRKISLDPDDEVRLTLRIKDRKGTKDEKGSEDYFLSIVITDKVHISHPDNDELKQDEEEFVFGSEYTPSEIVEFINGKINECQREEGIEDCPRMMETGGHVGSDTVTMNVPLLIRVFELVREDVKDDRELHFMAERILDIARKGTLTMEDYDYIAGTLEKPEIQEAIADAGYEVQEMADGGMMNKYAICTASLGRKYGMQRSLWDEETMDKYERCLDSVEKKMADGGEILLAPNGKPSNLTPEQYRLVRTPEFKAWFGDWQNSPETASKVVDENGEPLVVYHGTNNKFNVFSAISNRYFFSDNLDVANSYRNKYVFKEDEELGIDENEYEQFLDIVKINETPIYEVFLKIINPKIKDYKSANWLEYPIEKDIDKNNDGLIANNIIDGGSIIANTYIAFEPTQIKLADGSNTTFDGRNPDIRYDKGGSVKGVTEITHEDDGDTIIYGSKTNKTSVSVKGYSLDEIREELDFTKKMLARKKEDVKNFYINDVKFSRAFTGKEKEDIIKAQKANILSIEKDENIVIPFYEERIRAKSKASDTSNPFLDENVKQYKELAHAGKTASEILEEIGVDEGVYGEKNKEYTDFYLALAASDLSGKKFPKKARLTPVKLEGVEIPLKLKEKNVKITGIGNKDDILQLLKGVVGDDDLRPAMQGVYFDSKNKAAVATDAHKLVFIPDKSIKKSEIINPTDGNVIDQKFPDWKVVIPDYGKEDAVRVNVQYMLNVLHTVLNSAGYLDMPPFVVIIHRGGQFAFNAHVMYPVFEVMAKMGFDEVTMYLNSPRRGVLVKTDSGEVTGLVMPLLLSAFHDTFPGIYTILENGKEVQSPSGRIKTEPTEREIREFLESLTILSDAGDTDAAELLESMKIIYG